MTRDDATV